MTIADDVSVTCRHGVYPGVRLGRVASYDFEVPAQYEVADPTNRIQRAFLLLDDHMQLNQPLTFLGAYAGWWYVDLVEITEAGSAITVADHWIDVVVPPFGQPYQVRDLDEFGDALVAGQLTPEQAVVGLTRFQRFLDVHLRGELQMAPRTDWADFPPTALDPLRRPK